MITHAEYHAANPLPAVAIFAPFSAPAGFEPTSCVTRPYPFVDDDEITQKTLGEIVAEQEKRSATQKANFQRLRENRFRRVMAGNGQMPARDIATELHTTRDNIGSSLLLLINDGVVKRTGHGVATRYEWAGS